MPHASTVSRVADRIGISHRHFIRVFGEEVGLAPKAFCRVRRFQEVLRLVESEKRAGWAEVALACGYYDQAHLIGDFRAFSGTTPTAYLAQMGAAGGERLNHLPLGDR